MLRLNFIVKPSCLSKYHWEIRYDGFRVVNVYMIMKNWEGFPYYRLSTALNIEKVCLKRQKHISCCQDRRVDPE